jgi:hypothetical protein
MTPSIAKGRNQIRQRHVDKRRNQYRRPQAGLKASTDPGSLPRRCAGENRGRPVASIGRGGPMSMNSTELRRRRHIQRFFPN